MRFKKAQAMNRCIELELLKQIDAIAAKLPNTPEFSSRRQKDMRRSAVIDGLVLLVFGNGKTTIRGQGASFIQWAPEKEMRQTHFSLEATGAKALESFRKKHKLSTSKSLALVLSQALSYGGEEGIISFIKTVNGVETPAAVAVAAKPVKAVAVAAKPVKALDLEDLVAAVKGISARLELLSSRMDDTDARLADTAKLAGRAKAKGSARLPA